MTAARSYCRSQRCCNSCTVFFQPHDFAIMMARIGRRSNISSSFLVIDLTVSGCNPSETGRDIAIDIVRLLVTLNRCINIARFLRNCCVYYVMFFIIKRSVLIKCFFLHEFRSISELDPLHIFKWEKWTLFTRHHLSLQHVEKTIVPFCFSFYRLHGGMVPMRHV